MTSPARAATVLFSDAATAARVTERQLRNWLDRQQFRPLGDAGREDGRWRRFAPVDVVRLAVFGRLVANGCTVAEAGDVIGRHIDPRYRLLLSYRNTPAGVVAAPLRESLMMVHHGEAGPQISVNFMGEDPDPQAFGPDAADFVCLDLGKIARQALDKLEELTAAPSSDDDTTDDVDR